jgi:RNA polymerase sigma factor (sigma-70 family)
VKAYLHLNTFDGRAQFMTWLTRIAINSSLMILRRKRARPETSMDIGDGDTSQWEIADQTKSVEELYTGQERVERLKRAICRLQPTLRNVVEIHQSEDRSVKEVAELAGISVAATKSRLLRAADCLSKGSWNTCMEILIVDAPLQYPVIRARSGCQLLPSGKQSSANSDHPPRTSKTKLFHIEFSDLHVSKEDSIRPWCDQLKRQLFEAEYLADEDSVFVPADGSS